MKKFIMGITVGTTLLLGACSEETSKPVEEQEVTEVTEVKEEPKPEPVKEEPGLSPEEMEYIQTMVEYFTLATGNMEEIGILSSDAGADPSLFFSNDWKTEVVVQYESLVNNMTKVKDYPNVPEKFNELHRLTTLAADEYIKSKERYYYGVDNFDPDALGEAADHLTQGTQHLLQATEEVNRINEELGLGL